MKSRVFIERLVAAAVAIGACLSAGARPAAAAEPAGYEYFHTYAETVALMDATIADHPDIAQKFSIGTTYQGRKIWALKLTTDVAAGTQGRPEVLIEGLFHARERAPHERAAPAKGDGGDERRWP